MYSREVWLCQESADARNGLVSGDSDGDGDHCCDDHRGDGDEDHADIKIYAVDDEDHAVDYEDHAVDDKNHVVGDDDYAVDYYDDNDVNDEEEDDYLCDTLPTPGCAQALLLCHPGKEDSRTQVSQRTSYWNVLALLYLHQDPVLNNFL